MAEDKKDDTSEEAEEKEAFEVTESELDEKTHAEMQVLYRDSSDTVLFANDNDQVHIILDRLRSVVDFKVGPVEYKLRLERQPFGGRVDRGSKGQRLLDPV